MSLSECMKQCLVKQADPSNQLTITTVGESYSQTCTFITCVAKHFTSIIHLLCHKQQTLSAYSTVNCAFLSIYVIRYCVNTQQPCKAACYW